MGFHWRINYINFNRFIWGINQEKFNKDCNCRKPQPGMLLQGAQDFDLDLTKSYMIGDKISDVELAKKVGAQGILVLTGYGRGNYEHDREDWAVEPDYVAEDLYDAVMWILFDLGVRE